MSEIVLGLDIGGANLKAATSDGRSASVPFAVWKHPDRLSAELRKLIAKFPDCHTIRATMTAELCDCYETKREGVTRIVDDLLAATKKPVAIWSTAGKFVSPEEAKKQFLKVAAANWHALATFCGRFVPKGPALLIDMGTTTTDLIPIRDGMPATRGKTDTQRLDNFELLYMGWKRTPAANLLGLGGHASELFATVYDANIAMKLVPENAEDCDTADGRPATYPHCLSRLARMVCADFESISKRRILSIAYMIHHFQCYHIRTCIAYLQNNQLVDYPEPFPLITSGSGSFLIRKAIRNKRLAEKIRPFSQVISIASKLGPELSECAPAYALTQIS